MLGVWWCHARIVLSTKAGGGGGDDWCTYTQIVQREEAAISSPPKGKPASESGRQRRMLDGCMCVVRYSVVAMLDMRRCRTDVHTTASVAPVVVVMAREGGMSDGVG